MRVLSSIVSFMLLLLCTTGCQRVVQGERIHIAAILKTVSSEYWKFVESGITRACRDYGVRGTVVGPPSEGHLLDQVHLIEDVFSQRPDALIIAPILSSTAISVLERFYALHVPVLFVDTDVLWSSKVCFVGTDNLTAGKIGGEALARLLHAGDKVALISGALGNPSTDERIKGARQALQIKKMCIVSQQAADCDKAKAMSVMENMLQTYPDIQGVFAANDEMALGALRAIKRCGSKAKVIGTDGTTEAIKSILQGGLTGTVAQNPYWMGYRAVEMALKSIQGITVAKTVDSGVEVITRRNAREKLEFLRR